MASPAGRVYQHAADILDRIRARRGTAKSLCLGAPIEEKKKLYALVCETVKYVPVLDEVMEEAEVSSSLKGMKRSMQQVLVYDMLIGRGIQCGGKLKRMLAPHKPRLDAALARLLVRRGVHEASALVVSAARMAAEATPRYVRVNNIKWAMDSAVACFVAEGYALVDPPQPITALVPKTFCRDPHLADILVFAAKTDLHDHSAVMDGRACLQDKASCFPAWALSPPRGATVIDGCAAPGNKTTHLASLMENTGKIYAFEIDSKRVKLLRRFVDRAGATCVETVHGSFLDASPSDARFVAVDHILLDPSCSGSGIPGRGADESLAASSGSNRGDGAKRLAALADFQLSVIRHAFKFPCVTKVSYSTCSIHAEENEDVVLRALASSEGARFALAQALPQWQSRGLSDRDGGALCVRASVERDHTNGFFVALFVRKPGPLGEDPLSCRVTPNGHEPRLPVSGHNDVSAGHPLPSMQPLTSGVRLRGTEGSSNANKKRKGPRRMKQPVTR
eukprot:Opistho-2@94154